MMIESLVNFIQNFLLPWGAIGVFAASILEEVIAPIPSAFVLTSAGFFLIQSHAWSWAVASEILLRIAIPGALGVTIGSLFVYAIGYFAGKPLLARWGNFLGISWSEVEGLERRFDKGHSDELTLFIVRAVPAIPSVIISTFCGLIRIPFREYFIFSFLGTIVRAFILAFVGWQIGGLYVKFAGFISRVENGIFTAVALGVLIFIGYRLLKKYQMGSK